VVSRALSGVRRIRAMPPVRRSPLLLDDIRTLLAPLEFAAGSWPAGHGEPVAGVRRCAPPL
jgi:hypothetical protein